MKDESLDALKKARDKCASSVDKSALEQLDKAIEELESKMKRGESRRAQLRMVVRVYALLRFLVGLGED